MSELEVQLAELDSLKQGVSEGNNIGSFQSPDPNKIGQQGPNAGYGYGSRIGRERGAHSYKSVKDQTRATNGKIIGQMLIDGPQIRGEVGAEVTDAVSSALRDAENAVEREEVQRQYQRVVQTYFEKLAGLINGSPQAKPAADEQKPSAADDEKRDDE